MSTPRLSTIGMSLVEVMIACTILVLAISVGMGAIGGSSLTSLHRQNTDRALAEIQNQVESFQAMDDQTLQAQFGAGDNLYFPVAGLTPGSDPGTGAMMSQPLLVQRVKVVNAVHLTSLRFFVSWQDAGGPGSVEQFFHFTERR